MWIKPSLTIGRLVVWCLSSNEEVIHVGKPVPEQPNRTQNHRTSRYHAELNRTALMVRLMFGKLVIFVLTAVGWHFYGIYCFSQRGFVCISFKPLLWGCILDRHRYKKKKKTACRHCRSHAEHWDSSSSVALQRKVYAMHRNLTLAWNSIKNWQKKSPFIILMFEICCVLLISS